jgi:hypothetical protein
MSNVSKEKILEALDQLDPANAAQWTDDGLPVTKVVQKLTGDDTVQRSDITAAAPGFGKDTATARAAGYQENPGPTADPVTGVVSKPAPVADEYGDDLQAELEADLAFKAQECERLSAEVFAKQKEHGLAIKAKDKAMLLLHAKFPPMDAATAIKQHLASEQRKREEAHGVAGPVASQLDRTMAGRKAPLGWGGNARQQGRIDPRAAAAAMGAVAKA